MFAASRMRLFTPIATALFRADSTIKHNRECKCPCHDSAVERTYFSEHRNNEPQEIKILPSRPARDPSLLRLGCDDSKPLSTRMSRKFGRQLQINKKALEIIEDRWRSSTWVRRCFVRSQSSCRARCGK